MADAANAKLPKVDEDTQLALLRSVVGFTDTLLPEFDLDAILTRLVEVSARLADGAEVSITTGGAGGALHVAVGSCERKRVLEQYQLDNNDGPTIEVFRSGQQSTVELQEEGVDRWPLFAPLARAVGYRTIHSIPLRLRQETIGVISIAETTAGASQPIPIGILRALADSVTIGILHQRAFAAANELSRQLQGALTTRIVIEQAKGVVSVCLGVTIDESFEVLRSYSRGYNRKLHEVSQAVLDGSLAVSELKVPRNAHHPRPGSYPA
jgi:transcriptional regulator with GAF, ATPase, and Fis domain